MQDSAKKMPLSKQQHVLHENGSAGQGNLVFFNQFAHVNQGIAHATQSCINAYVGVVGNFLETHAAVMPHKNNLLLIFGQQFEYTAYIGADLLINQTVFDVGIRKLMRIKQIHLVVIVRACIQVTLFSEIVNGEVMGNTQDRKSVV